MGSGVKGVIAGRGSRGIARVLRRRGQLTIPLMLRTLALRTAIGRSGARGVGTLPRRAGAALRCGEVRLRRLRERLLQRLASTTRWPIGGDGESHRYRPSSQHKLVLIDQAAFDAEVGKHSAPPEGDGAERPPPPKRPRRSTRNSQGGSS